MTIESTNDNKPTTPAITYSECYQQPFVSLFHEDCIETMKRIPDGSIDLMLTDPPYNTIACEWDKPINLPELWKEWARIIKPNGALIFTSTQPFTTDLINSNRKLFRYDLIWNKTRKTGFLNANKMPNRAHETLLVFYKEMPVYNPIKYSIDERFQRKGVRYSNSESCNPFNITGKNTKDYSYTEDGTRLPDSILQFNSCWEKDMHPTQKPVDLMRYLILTYSNKGETVFDGYSGSGTTAEACIIEGRKFIGSELNKEYFEKSVLRLKNVPTQLF